MRLQRLFIGVLLFTVIVSCQTVPAPVEDYSLARAALDAARSVQAARHSPGYWHQAEEAYRKGRIYFEDRDYSKAKEQFVRARVSAEKAENSARLIRQRTGDVL
ncbi:DUF4398 domain-containing protein [Bdellovibrio bacteriovorus]|uniref:DUF4398 domain-containing protein n=1 Tax=Bdellovibrio bacteriovorus TaxID=959 RepID=A0A150WIT6_BDEBC|nr:DUF4398 domain-containing protein [Bdellovibrio bacteriovorus]KYG63345.1 hypothetical protein AZI85_04745 [Bdellovibrio bacteriovorus]KYG69461.1 hypothetical protein AZI87_09785 [Bdellovibrio bacteriovorus]